MFLFLVLYNRLFVPCFTVLSISQAITRIDAVHSHKRIPYPVSSFDSLLLIPLSSFDSLPIVPVFYPMLPSVSSIPSPHSSSIALVAPAHGTRWSAIDEDYFHFSTFQCTPTTSVSQFLEDQCIWLRLMKLTVAIKKLIVIRATNQTYRIVRLHNSSPAEHILVSIVLQVNQMDLWTM